MLSLPNGEKGEGIFQRRIGGGGVEVQFKTDRRRAVNVVGVDESAQYGTIQEAINDLPKEGGEVFVKEGTYTIETSININKDNIILRGASWGALIQGSATFPNVPLVLSAGKDNLIIDNIQIGGTKGINGIDFDSCDNCVISNCKMSNASADGIDIDNCENVTVRNCLCLNTSSDAGIFLKSTSKFCIVENNRMISCKIQLEGADKCIVSKNMTDGNTHDGIIYLSGAANNNIISNNQIHNGDTYCIYLEGGNDYNVIEGNRCAVGRTGVEIEAGSDKTLVTGNNCVGCTNAVVDAGTNTTAANNTT